MFHTCHLLALGHAHPLKHMLLSLQVTLGTDELLATVVGVDQDKVHSQYISMTFRQRDKSARVVHILLKSIILEPSPVPSSCSVLTLKH